MPNRPARFTTADLRRAVRAAELAGPEWFVEVLPGGTIRITQGALAWTLWLLWVNTQHPFSWFSTLIWAGYVGWVLWSKWRTTSRRRYPNGTGPEKISPPENSN